MNKGTVVIIGDSWAESMWRVESIDTLVNGHIHGILEQHGYRVYNFGIIGGSNLKSWQSYESLLEKEEHPPDLVIWIHTEVLRDYDLYDKDQYNKQWTYRDLVSRAANESYSEIRKIIDKYSIDNIFLIEGPSTVVQPEFSKHIPDPVYTIKSWRNKILDMPDLAEPYVVAKYNIFGFGQNLDSVDTKCNVLSEISSVLDAMEKSPLFPDNAHPGREAHEQLAAEILDFMNKTSH